MPSEPLIADVYSRSSQSLNGRWHVLIDPMDVGNGGALGPGFGANRKQSSPAELIEYGFENAETLEVPGDWNTQAERLFFYEGVVWYQRDFSWSRTPGTRAFLYFGAANYRATAWVNGQSVGTHVGGFTPFNFEVSDALTDGDNFVVVRVDSRHASDDIPTPRTDWFNYGGLTRDVFLVSVPETFIRSYSVQLQAGSRRTLAGWVQLAGPSRQQEVHVRVPELGIDVALRTDAAGFAELEVPAEPELWSPERPRLYRVEVAAATDRLADDIGFRTVEARDGEILLNGEPLFLRGISIHEESLLRPGRAVDADDAEVLFGLVRELGANFVRLAHYPHNEHMVRAADQMGFLVWEEIPTYWGIDWQNPETLDKALGQLTEMISRDRNRAATILWSMANETPETPERTAFLSELVRHARALDPTRLITGALFGRPGELLKGLAEFVTARAAGEEVAPLHIRIDDPLAELLDVVGYNQYLGWYYSAWIAQRLPLSEGEIRRIVLGSMAEFTIDVPSGKPLIISEFGAGAKQGRHGDEGEIWSEEYQARVYTEQLRMLSRVPALRGISPWILKDFRTPRRLLPGIQDYYNRKGLVSERGLKKRAFFILRDFFAGKQV
jgi:beta-glucuronidase